MEGSADYTAFDIVNSPPRSLTITMRLVMIPPRSHEGRRQRRSSFSDGLIADRQPIRAPRAIRPSAEFLDALGIRRRVSSNRGFFHPVFLAWVIRSPIQSRQQGHFTAAPPTGFTSPRTPDAAECNEAGRCYFGTS
jgi:hypothetical protein